MKISLNTRLQLAKQKYQEYKIAKHFCIHNKWTYATEAADKLYGRREALASYAKKNKIKIDVYNPEHLEQKYKSDIGISGLENLTEPHIGVVVTSKKTGKRAVELIDADINKDYPKEATSFLVLPVKGEENLQIARLTRWTKIDGFLQHVFRTIEGMQRAVSNK